MECALCNDTGGVPTGEHIGDIVVVKYCDCEMGQVIRDVEQELPYLLAADDVSEFWRTRPWHDRLFDRLAFLLMWVVSGFTPSNFERTVDECSVGQAIWRYRMRKDGWRGARYV
jgi:hypothetical protein